MQTKIARPDNDYSPEWAAYWEQNPNMLRSVGADAVEGEGGEDGGEDAGGGDDVDYKSMLAKLEAQNKELSEKANTFEAKHREAEKHRKAQEAAARKAAEEAAKSSGDIESLEKSWTEKLNAVREELGSEASTYKEMVYKLTVGNTAISVANELAMDGQAPLILPHIERHLKTEIVNGEPVVKVVDENGHLTSDTLDDFKAKLKKIPWMASVIKGSSASGGGNISGKGGGGGGAKEITREEFDKLPPHEKAKAAREKKIV